METIILHDITRALFNMNNDCMELVKSLSKLNRFQGRKVRLTDDKGVDSVGFYSESAIRSSVFKSHEIYIVSYLQKVKKDGTPSMQTNLVYNPTKIEILD